MKLAFLLLFICQIADYAALSLGLGEVNQRFIFGSFGNNWFAILASMFFLASFVVFSSKKQVHSQSLIVMAGAISNIIDRIIYGGVVDYISLPKITTFNLADVVIVFGLISISFSVLDNKKDCS